MQQNSGQRHWIKATKSMFSTLIIEKHLTVFLTTDLSISVNRWLPWKTVNVVILFLS